MNDDEDEFAVIQTTLFYGFLKGWKGSSPSPFRNRANFGDMTICV